MMKEICSKKLRKQLKSFSALARRSIKFHLTFKEGFQFVFRLYDYTIRYIRYDILRCGICNDLRRAVFCLFVLPLRKLIKNEEEVEEEGAE